MMFKFRRRLLGLLLAAASCGCAAAEGARSYAVVSLLADALTVVGQEAVTGSALNRNPVEATPMAFEMLELPALQASVAAVKNAAPGARVAPVKLTDPAIYAQRSAMIEPGATRASLPPAIVDPLRAAGISHIVLVRPFRADARFDTGQSMLGSGKIEGVGLYVDRETHLRSLANGEVTVGYLGGYVYAQVALVELVSQSVQGTVTTTLGRMLTAHGSDKGADPWTLLSDADKVNALRVMIQNQLDTAITQLLKSP